MNHLIKLSIAVALSAVLLTVAGCAGITPYEPPDYRDKPPGNGVLTGADGEFVIYRKADESETGSEVGKSSDETVESKQQEKGKE
jgi:hypothetical protein